MNSVGTKGRRELECGRPPAVCDKVLIELAILLLGDFNANNIELQALTRTKCDITNK